MLQNIIFILENVIPKKNLIHMRPLTAWLWFYWKQNKIHFLFHQKTENWGWGRYPSISHTPLYYKHLMQSHKNSHCLSAGNNNYDVWQHDFLLLAKHCQALHLRIDGCNSIYFFGVLHELSLE